jgi:hypothetical protein
MKNCIGILTILWMSFAISHRADAEKPLVLAYYYPWYQAGDWSRHGYVGTPILGKYGTDSPKVAEQHIDWCADHGIDGVFVSWWGRDHMTDKHLKAGLLKSNNLRRIKYGMYYESLGILDETDGKKDGVVDFAEKGPLQRMIADFKIIAADHFNHPQYLKFNGRPVVGFYVSGTFKNFSRKHLEQLNEAIGQRIYAIGDEAFFWDQAKPSTSRNGSGAFDAYSAYNLFEPKCVQDGDTALTFQSREVFPIFRDWASEVPFFPGIMPSYHDFRGHPVLAGTPQDFATILKAASAIAKSPEPGVPPMIFLTSFNEWWEGTTVEPAEEYGTKYLEVIRDFKDQWTPLLDKELSNFEVWLGIPHSSVKGLPEGTFQSDDVHKGTPLGLDADVKNVFSVVEKATKNGKPLTRGQIQIQSEGAECYYKNLRLRTIQDFPERIKEAGGLTSLPKMP